MRFAVLADAHIGTIIHDSMKHAALCQALIDVEAWAAPTTLDVDMATALELHQSIKQHARAEEEMIRRLEDILAHALEDSVWAILSHIL
jgi:hypothetical protein